MGATGYAWPRPVQPGDPDRVAGHTGRAWRAAPLLAIALIAFLARLLPVLLGGGLTGILNYDDGVYYASATALVWGQLPYQDYLLLHPPGITVLLAPFAALGGAAGDPVGLATARLGFMLLGAVNAVLVAVLARRLGGPPAGLTAGFLYAVFPPAVYAEHTSLLTGPGNTALLLALLLLLRPVADVSARAQVWAGAALGAACTVKIWGAVPLAVVVAWQLLARRPGWAGRVALGSAAATTVICLPFFVAAPGEMTRMVLLDQLGRPSANESLTRRLAGVLGLSLFARPGDLRPPFAVLLLAAAFIAVLVLLAAVRVAAARPVVGLLVAQGVVLAAQPSYFKHYAAFAAPALLVCTGVGAAALLASVPRERRWAPALVAALPFLVFGAAGVGAEVGVRYPADRLRPAVASSRCVTSDSPVTLAALDVLSRNLARGCTVWVDVTGLTYGRAKAPPRPDGAYVPRRHNATWQRALLGYLTSGDATMIVRPQADGFSPATQRELARLPVLAEADGFRILGVPGR